MFKTIMSITLSTIILSAGNVGFEYEGITIKNTDSKGNLREIIVKRDIAKECQKLLINNEMVWTGDYAHSKVPKACKSIFVKTTGKLLPMYLDEDIDTYGELEVLSFIKRMQDDSSKLLIDARKESWFNYRTIPGSINMPFHHFKERNSFEFEFEQHLRDLNVVMNSDEIYNDETLDFDNAKTIAIFCNGPWCSQSVAMINILIELGYPAENIKWYRGGIQTWLAGGLTSTRD